MNRQLVLVDMPNVDDPGTWESTILPYDGPDDIRRAHDMMLERVDEITEGDMDAQEEVKRRMRNNSISVRYEIGDGMIALLPAEEWTG